MQELYPGLFKITIALKGFSPGSVNLYALKDGAGFSLIDTGWDLPESIESLQSQLNEAGFSLKDIQRVFLTHCHSDHLGMVNRLKNEYHAQILLHQDEQIIIAVRYNPQVNYWDMTDRFLRTHGIPASELPPLKSPFPEIKNLVQADVWLKGGESFQVGAYRLTVINTPGHTPGHVAYYEPRQRLLFAGDTLLPTIATNAATHIQQMPNPLKQYLNSLQHLRELDIELVLPGHEQPFTDHRLRIDQLLAHHTSRSTAVQTLVEAQNQPVNAYHVARLISWSPKNKAVHWEQLAALDKRFAMMQAIAHLEMLAAQKKLIRIALHGKISYQSVEKTD